MGMDFNLITSFKAHSKCVSWNDSSAEIQEIVCLVSPTFMDSHIVVIVRKRRFEGLAPVFSFVDVILIIEVCPAGSLSKSIELFLGGI